MIIIPHHPQSPNFFIENPIKQILIFFWDYLYAFQLHYFYLSLQPWGGFNVYFWRLKNGKSSKIKLIVYSHQQFNLLGFSLNLALKICLFWIFEFIENFNLNFELREDLVLGHKCTSAKWVNVLLFKSSPPRKISNFQHLPPFGKSLTDPWASFPSVFVLLTIHVLCQPLKISFQTCKYQIKKIHLETLVW